MQWQFIVFEHNKHEINKTSELKNELKIESIYFKAPWNSKPFDSETKREIIKNQTFKIDDIEILDILKN